MTDDKFQEMAETIGRLSERAFAREGYFNLFACGNCGGPSFGQPCAICNYYPMGHHGDPSTAGIKASRERFVAAVEKAGGIAAWYFNSDRKTVAYRDSYFHRQTVDKVIADARELPNLPSAAEVWEHVVTDGCTISRPFREQSAHVVWSAMHELRQFRESLIERMLPNSDEHRFSEALDLIKGDIVGLIHENTREATADAATLTDGLLSQAMRLHTGAQNGNLHRAAKRVAEWTEVPSAPGMGR